MSFNPEEFDAFDDSPTFGSIKSEEDECVLLSDAVDEYLNDCLDPTPKMIIETGLPELDEIIGGMVGGEYTVIAGRPGSGKTSLMWQILMHVAGVQKKPTLFFSLEMKKELLVARMIAGEYGVSVARQLKKEFYPGELERMKQLRDLVRGRQIYIFDSVGISARKMREKVEHMIESKGIQFVAIDYLGLLDGDAPGNRTEEVRKVSREIKKMVSHAKIPALVLSQLSRKCEEREDKRPVMSDIRDSGDVEQDAAGIIFVYRDEVYNPNTRDKGIAELLVRKSRYGAANETARMGWDGPRMRFVSNPPAPIPFDEPYKRPGLAEVFRK